jgi:hypothetical protein
MLQYYEQKLIPRANTHRPEGLIRNAEEDEKEEK